MTTVGTAGRRHRLLKVCGITTPDEVGPLAAAGADLVGLWWGIPGGPADLPVARLVELAATVRATGRLEPVLVTFDSDAERLAEVLRQSGIRWVQLHAYQTPGMVRALRAAIDPATTVVKVLHVRGTECVERRFIPAYVRAGTDVFLLDTATADGRVGSTGQRLSGDVAAELVDAFDRPFLLAGGLTADNVDEYEAITAHPRMHGVDVDTAARDDTRRFRPELVTALAARWRTGPPREDR
ncbi:hypothetical protein ACIG87_21025 [Micromonospora sp. NPDC051925]|uniref:phosphoribosylanthranilate isomerase n=1 Tax=Micromonospora sp. NPDC051925 TaxID=3364288 RepID=UPI0037C8D7F9